MKIKRIAFTGVKKAELIDFELGELQSDEILVRTTFTAISNGTEKANLFGQRSGAKDNANQFPRYLGYSSVGTVAKVGASVTEFAVGDRVSGYWSTHSNYNIFKEKDVVKVEEGIRDEWATLGHIATFPMAAIRKIKPEIGESALVMGLGVLGVFAVMFAKQAGAVPVIAADPVKERRELALKCGADYALDPTEEGFAAEVRKLTGNGVNACIEVTGLGKGLDQALDCMAKFGRIALLGCTRDSNFTIDYYQKVHMRGIMLIGAHTNARPELESASGWWTHNDDRLAFYRMLKYGRLDLSNFISEIHDPHDAPEVFTRLCEDKNFPLGVLFDWRNID